MRLDNLVELVPGKTASRIESTDASQQKAAKVLATYMHDEFTAAFRKSSGAHFKIVDTPSSDALRLDLALFEPSGISTEKALLLLIRGGGALDAMPSSLLLQAPRMARQAHLPGVVQAAWMSRLANWTASAASVEMPSAPQCLALGWCCLPSKAAPPRMNTA